MTDVFKIKQGDTSPTLRYEVSADGFSPVGATITFSMVGLDGVRVINNAPADYVVGAAIPVLTYDWSVGDTDVLGTFKCEFVVTYVGGAVETVPNEGALYVRVTPRI